MRENIRGEQATKSRTRCTATTWQGEEGGRAAKAEQALAMPFEIAPERDEGPQERKSRMNSAAAIGSP